MTRLYINKLILAAVFSLSILFAAPARAEYAVTDSETYVQIAAFIVPIFAENRVAGTLELAVGLHVPQSGPRSRIKDMMPRLIDRYLDTLKYFVATRVDFAKPVDVDSLAKRLQQVTDGFEKGKAEVLIARAVLRRTANSG